MSVDIVIPQYGRADLTVECLKAVAKCTRDYRIVLIDDGTEDKDSVKDVLSMLKMLEMPHTFFVSRKNRGFSNAANRGMSLGDTEFLVLLNNDVVVTDGWLDKLLVAIQTSAKIALITPVTDNASSFCQCDKVGVLLGYKGEDPATFFNSSLPRVLDVPSSNVPAFCSLMRRSVIYDRLGGFDEDFIMFGQDDDLNDRIRGAGYKTCVCGNCFVYHKHGATVGSHPKREELRRKDRETLLRKRRERADARRA